MRASEEVIIVLGGAGGTIFPSQRVPTINDDTTKGYQVNDLWYFGGHVWQVSSVTGGAAVWTDITQAALPLDVTPNVAVFAGGLSKLSSNTNITKCLKLFRWNDSTSLDIGFKANGDIDDVAADAFAAPAISAGNSVEVITLYDQSFAVAAGALRGNDAVALPGWNAVSAAIATAGSGMTPGATIFTLVGANNVAAQFSGTVAAGGTLTGALTAVASAAGSPSVSGSYLAQLTNPVSVTSSAGGVQPTLNITWTQTAPVWNTNKVNGKRVISFAQDYGAGNPNSYFAPRQGLALPSAFGINARFVTMVGAFTPGQVQGVSIVPAFSIDAPVAGNAFWLNQNVNNPGMGMFSASTTATPLTSPAVWSLQTGAAATTFSDNNESGSITLVEANATKNAGFIGGGAQGHAGLMDLHHIVLFNFTTLNAVLTPADLLKVKTSSIILSQTTTQTRENLVVGVGDSQIAGFKSIAGNNYLKFMTTLGLLPASVAVKNMGYSGGTLSGGVGHDFTAQFTTDWAGVYSSSIPRIIVLMDLGVNDLVNGASVATVYTRLQTLATSILAQGSNVALVYKTEPPRQGLDDTTQRLPLNALIRANALVPIGSGGLGGSGFADLANAFPWNDPSFTNYLNATDQAHMLDTGYAISAPVIARSVKALLLN